MRIEGTGDGVDAGIGLGLTILFVTLPLIGVSLVLGLVGVIKRRGKVPAAVAVGVNSAALAVGVYGFVSTQIL